MIAKAQATEEDSSVYDVIIIGAGPCGLATAARLREQHPSALFTDEEQARYSWISRNSSVKNRRDGRIHGPCSGRGKNSKKGKKELNILVLDATGEEWMKRWNGLFDRLTIKFLRSPMFFHPDPRDRDALLACCHAQNGKSKKGENIQEIAGCVGKEISKHKKKQRTATCCAKAPKEINERDRQDYFAPSARAFRRFCEECVERCELGDIVRKGKVLDITYDVVSGLGHGLKLFTIRVATTVYHARTAVLAMGGGEPIIPAPFGRALLGSASHALDLSPGSNVVPPYLREKISAGLETNILVVGGGLTSAQVADCLLRCGISKVHLIMRGPWKIKPFDVDLVWMGKWHNTEKAYFWSEEDFEERLAMAKQARGGGSITPRYSKVLKEWMRNGRLVVHPHTRIAGQKWDAVERMWSISTEPPLDQPAFGHVVFATGLGSDVSTMDMFQGLRESHPIESFGGFPALTDDPMWNDDVPLFMTGKMAMLQLGPGAGNLEGARLGAESIAWGISKALGGSLDDDDGVDDGSDRYVMGIGSKYDGLLEEDSGVEL